MIISEDYIDLLIDFPLEEYFPTFPEKENYVYQKIDEKIGILSLNREILSENLITVADYQFFPDLLGLQNLEQRETNEFRLSPLIEAGVVAVQSEPLSLSGRNVMVAFIDTGINWKNEIFKNEDGSSRILAIWDQTDQSGVPPENMLYGSEYSREMLNAGNSTTGDSTGHGTMMAATACGSKKNSGIDFLSPAYEADIVMVKLKDCKNYLRDYYLLEEDVLAYQSSDICMAMKYIDDLAGKNQRPVVICLGLGTNYRDHAGNGILSRYIDSICEKRNRAVVITAGNEGNARHHMQGIIRRNNMEASLSSGFEMAEKLELEVSKEMRGFMMQVWTDLPARLNFGIQSPSGEMVKADRIPLSGTMSFQFIYENTIVTVFRNPIDKGSGDGLILIRFEKPVLGIWTLYIENNGGFSDLIFDSWLPITDFSGDGLHFLRSSVETTITSPGYAEEAIVCSSYNSYNNSFDLNAGRGFGRANQLKPDVTLPGVDITTVGNRIGTEARISSFTGGSVAAAILAGATAQFMQWAVIDGNVKYIRSNEIKNYFIGGAKRRKEFPYPNPQSGYGKFSLEGVFRFLAEN